MTAAKERKTSNWFVNERWSATRWSKFYLRYEHMENVRLIINAIWLRGLVTTYCR